MSLKVLQIISGFAVEGPLGGLERFGIELSNHLDQARVENTLVGLWSYGQPTEQAWMDQAHSEGSAVWMGPDYDFTHPYQSFLDCYRAFNAHFRGQHFDVIHSHCQFGDVLALLTAHRLGARVKLRTVHNEREWGRRPLRNVLLTNILYPLLFDAEAAVSQRVVDNLNARPLAKLLERKAQRIYNAVNLNRFIRPAMIKDIRSAYSIPEDAHVIGSIGRLTEQKGYCYLVDAARQVIEQCPDVYFMIVGVGELQDALVKQIQDSGIEDHVILTGALTNIEQVLWNWDVFVSSSMWEGLPTVLLESMAAGVPVIATDVSGTRELVQNEKNGLLVSPGDSNALARAILRQYTDPALVEMVEVASETVKQFSIQTVAREYEFLYENLCKTPENRQ